MQRMFKKISREENKMIWKQFLTKFAQEEKAKGIKFKRGELFKKAQIEYKKQVGVKDE